MQSALQYAWFCSKPWSSVNVPYLLPKVPQEMKGCPSGNTKPCLCLCLAVCNYICNMHEAVLECPRNTNSMNVPEVLVRAPARHLRVVPSCKQSRRGSGCCSLGPLKTLPSHSSRRRHTLTPEWAAGQRGSGEGNSRLGKMVSDLASSKDSHKALISAGMCHSVNTAVNAVLASRQHMVYNCNQPACHVSGR
jgi:hypothetical protein